jgi:hypothetical protein
VKVAYNRTSDTIRQTVTVDLASANSSNGAVNVTLGVDAAAITAFNTANGTSYVALPAGSFKLLNPTVTIPAGQHYAQTTLEIYTKGLNPATSYMTPISITDGGGKKLSSNLNTLYYYTIGNPLAGTYTWMFRRWNNTQDTTAATAAVGTGSTFAAPKSVSASPAGPTTLLLPDEYLNVFVDSYPTVALALNFTNTAGVLSGFNISIYDPGNEVAAGGFTVAIAPKLIDATIRGTAANGYAGSTFTVYTSLINSSGGVRTTVDQFTKQ